LFYFDEVFMLKRIPSFLLSLILAMAFGVLHTGADAQEKEKIKKEQCLGCHGSYDKLAEKTANYKADSGETLSPHRYIPHEEKTNIPECTECHTPHSIPLTDKSTVVKPKDLGFCHQTGCHHMPNFQACKSCHGGG